MPVNMHGFEVALPSEAVSMRTYRPVFALLLALSFALVVGCGKSEPLFPVSGKILDSKGNPIKEGVVTYVPDEAKGNKSKSNPSGKITDGSYTITTEGKPGAPAGHYKVTVQADTPGIGGGTQVDPNPKGAAPLNPGGNSQVNPMYKDAKQTDLAKEVKADAPSGHYDLKLTH